MSKSCDRFVDAYPEQWAKLREEAIAMAPDLDPDDIDRFARWIPADWIDLRIDAEFIIDVTKFMLKWRNGGYKASAEVQS